MAELAEQLKPTPKFPSLRWLTRIFNGRPQPAVETPFPISPVPEPIVIKPAMPVTAQEPKPSGRELRTQRIREYRERQAATRPIDAPAAPAHVTPIEAVTPQVSEAKPEFNQQLLLTRKQIPWLEQPNTSIPLELRTFPGTPGRKFLYADFIHSRKLTEAANHLAQQQGVDIDKLTFTHLTEDFLKSGRHPYIKDILNPLTDKPIYCIYNPSGPRVYFMRRDAIQGFPVIIRLAACDKEGQIDVLTTISDWKKEKRVKRRLERRGKN